MTLLILISKLAVTVASQRVGPESVEPGQSLGMADWRRDCWMRLHQVWDVALRYLARSVTLIWIVAIDFIVVRINASEEHFVNVTPGRFGVYDITYIV